VPDTALPVTATTQAALAAAHAAAAESDTEAESAHESTIAPWAAAGAALAGLAGWTLGEAFVRRQRRNEKKKYESAADCVFGSLAFE
jgi:hypothetical protein